MMMTTKGGKNDSAVVPRIGKGVALSQANKDEVEDASTANVAPWILAFVATESKLAGKLM